MPFLEYLWRSFVGRILVTQWQIHFGFATGEFVVMCALRNQRNEKEEQQAEDEGIIYFPINIYISIQILFMTLIMFDILSVICFFSNMIMQFVVKKLNTGAFQNSIYTTLA